MSLKGSEAAKARWAKRRGEVPPEPEVPIIDPEVLPPLPREGVTVEETEKGLVVRSDGSVGPKGAFAPGHKGGLRRGSVNRLTKAMRQAAMEQIEAGGDRANPMLVLLKIMTSPDADLKLQAECADRLAKHIWGVKNSFEVEAPDEADEERIVKTKKLIAGLFMMEQTEVSQ